MAEIKEYQQARREALHHKRYGASVLSRIREAKTEQELHTNLLRALSETSASAATKRKWRAAAERRLASLRIIKPGRGGLVLPGRLVR